MNLHCLSCGKPVPQTEGKRAKSYCGNTCRVKSWKKQKQAISQIEAKRRGRPKKETSGLAKEASARSKKSIQSVVDSKKEVVSGPIREVIKEVSENNARLGIETMIASIKAEKLPKDRDSILGKKSWMLDQRKKIEQLEKQLSEL